MAIRPKLGQHFLRDAATLERIARAAALPGDTVVEVGPGRGALTKQLIVRAKRIIAVELDARLARTLSERCGQPENLKVVCKDILQCHLPILVRQESSDHNVVVGNLPYYITSPVLRLVFSSRHLFRSATFLVQEEVADRAVAEPGSSAYGFMSCLCRLHSKPRKLFTVPPSAFSPRPKVSSAAVQFVLCKPDPPNGLQTFLSACFRFPRKTLRNNLIRCYPRDRVVSDPCAGLRAHQVGIEELAAMWRRILPRPSAD